MTDPAFAMKQQVENLVALQIDTLGRRYSLTQPNSTSITHGRKRSQAYIES